MLNLKTTINFRSESMKQVIIGPLLFIQKQKAKRLLYFVAINKLHTKEVKPI